MSGMGEKATGMGDRVRSTVSGASEKISGAGVSERVSGVSEKLKGSVNVSSNTDTLSNKIDIFLDEKSDQLIKDWELATKDDILDIEKRYTQVSNDMSKLEGDFNEYRDSTNKNLKKIEERLDKLENIE
jgi:archaellum component FlaC